MVPIIPYYKQVCFCKPSYSVSTGTVLLKVLSWGTFLASPAYLGLLSGPGGVHRSAVYKSIMRAKRQCLLNHRHKEQGGPGPPPII